MLRKMIATLTIGIALLALVYAFREHTGAPTPEWTRQGWQDKGAAAYNGLQPLAVTGKAIAWTSFAATKEIDVEEKGKDGFINYSLRPGFTKEMQARNGKTVTLMGFMFPLTQGREQAKFMFGPYPMSCPYHYHATNNQIVLINPTTPLPFSLEPITLEGVLRLHDHHPEMFFYTLEQARLVPR
jgi:hypothetical protein